MNKKSFFQVTLSLIAIGALCTSCLSRSVFGVNEELWNRLSPKEREQVISNHHRVKEKEIEKNAQIRAQELQNERVKQEWDAKNAPLLALSDTVGSLFNKQESTKQTPSSKNHSIQAISFLMGSPVIQVEGVRFEISPFEGINGGISSWLVGQPVKIGSSKELLYNVVITNLENGETISAKRLH